MASQSLNVVSQRGASLLRRCAFAQLALIFFFGIRAIMAQLSIFTSPIAGWWFGTMEFITFHSVGNGIIIPTDELTPSFFRGVGGSTTNQSLLKVLWMIFQMGHPPVTGESFCWISNSEVGRCGWIGYFSVFRKCFSNPKNCMCFFLGNRP